MTDVSLSLITRDIYLFISSRISWKFFKKWNWCDFILDPTIVTCRISILGLNSVDESLMVRYRRIFSFHCQIADFSGMVSNIQTFSTDIYFTQKWQDLRLFFPNITSDYRVLDLEWLKRIWRPDTFFRNAKSVQFETVTTPNHYLWIYRNNTIMHTMKLSLTLACAMDFAFYPHDMQKCSIQVESSKLPPIAYLFITWQNEH